MYIIPVPLSHHPQLGLLLHESQVWYPRQTLSKSILVVFSTEASGHCSEWVVQSIHCPNGKEAKYAFLSMHMPRF